MSRTSDRFVDYRQQRDAEQQQQPQQQSARGTRKDREDKRSRSPYSPETNDRDHNSRSNKLRRNASPEDRYEIVGGKRDSRRPSPPPRGRADADNRLKRRRSPSPDLYNGRRNDADRSSGRRSRSPKHNNIREEVMVQAAKVASAAAEDVDEDEKLQAMMGFSGFDSSKGKKHADVGEAQVAIRRRYRQYMNRKGGFNRPLDPIK